MKILLIVGMFIPCVFFAQGSFPGGAGQVGTTAIHKDSSVFVSWATNCITTRGPQDIAVPSSPLVTTGDDYMATGMSGANGTVTLGDGGEAILSFDYPIINGAGWDFAVFENSFDGMFLELAFVEVSSDGVNYFRFPATTEVQDTLQTDPYGNTDPTEIDNLAGKYKAQYGTPFDLNELAGTTGLNVDSITHIKIIDVIGTIDEAYASFDQYGNKINDPYPTDFAAGGFDLDAVGVIHHDLGAGISRRDINLNIYPSATSAILNIECNELIGDITVYSLDGKAVLAHFANQKQVSIFVEDLESGIYVLSTRFGTKQFVKY